MISLNRCKLASSSAEIQRAETVRAHKLKPYELTRRAHKLNMCPKLAHWCPVQLAVVGFGIREKLAGGLINTSSQLGKRSYQLTGKKLKKCTKLSSGARGVVLEIGSEARHTSEYCIYNPHILYNSGLFLGRYRAVLSRLEVYKWLTGSRTGFAGVYWA